MSNDIPFIPQEAAARAVRVAAEMATLQGQFNQNIAAAEMLFRNASITSASPLVHELADKIPGVFELAAMALGQTPRGRGR